ncbi:TraM recognition domain-containing protein [Acidithiobacillus caldus ATCC 51756]|jgi:hypothetical protein|uniref:type IV secretory system conjugative DNA transfer family protein n=1 Tax=Acidithiobacillus caldus TaxID=33059 RepID=UPI001C064FEE|nr:TraM recognition domain-containing protein [Acidithiobacillus caldus]MBU2734559.1 TraM recognition domain-containing protein [Acidithiobacillus caldus ATCC 51756]MBU2803061.1 TraM recognition domain-containing protein [Acidithiobacillus caldus]
MSHSFDYRAIGKAAINDAGSGLLHPARRAAVKRWLADFFERRVLGDPYREYPLRTADPVMVHDDASVRHEVAVGKSGAGKTVYLVNKAVWQIRRGGGLGVIESKSDYEFRDMTYALCDAYGRSLDFRCVNIDNAAESHTYSPWNRGDNDVGANRISDTVDTGGNPSGEHFKAMGHSALQATIGAIKHLGYLFNALDLYILLSNPNAMEWLEMEVHKKGRSEAATQYTMFLDSYRITNHEGQRVIDMNRMRQQIGGVVNRLYPYGIGDMGKVLNPYSPDVDLLRVHDESQILFIMTPELEKSEAARAFARIVFSDLRSVIARMYTRRAEDRLPIPFRWLCDEFGSYAVRQITTPLEMMRGANIGMTMFFQAVASMLEPPLDATFLSKVIANTDVKTFLPLGDPESMEYAAEFCSKDLQDLGMRSRQQTKAAGNKNLDFELFHSVSDAESEGFTTREQYDYRVRPEEFRDLEVGEAIVVHGKHIMKLRFPKIETAVRPERFVPIRMKNPFQRGLDLQALYDTEFRIAG